MRKIVLLIFAIVATVFDVGALAAQRKLSWAPPKLDKPETVQLGERRGYGLKLKKDRDYIVKLPKDKPFIGELNIYGGRNVVIIGGEIRIPGGDEDPEYAEGRRSRSAPCTFRGPRAQFTLKESI